MTDEKLGSIMWHDLSVVDAMQTQDFYSKVVGWVSEPVGMGGYDDFNMNQVEDGQCVAGVCHAKGVNANLPPQWLMYVKVPNADDSAQQCVELGGKILVGPTAMGEQTYYTLQDPNGAVFAIFT